MQMLDLRIMLHQQVHVYIRGQLAACSGKNALYMDTPRSSHRDYCGFKYSQMATPTVTNITPRSASNNETVTISGTGFSETASENYVVFGDVDCSVVSSTPTAIECVLGRGFAGFKGLYLHVLYSGVAETGAFGITFNLVLTGISPPQGSQAGGTEVTISGEGFYYELHSSDGTSDSVSATREAVSSYLRVSDATDCPSGWENVVLLGGNPCTLIQSTMTSLTVITPPETAGGLSPSHDLEVTVSCPDHLNISLSTTMQDAYTYNSALTPTVATITPTAGTIQGGQEVNITGSGFSTSSEENQVLVSSIQEKMRQFCRVLQLGCYLNTMNSL